METYSQKQVFEKETSITNALTSFSAVIHAVKEHGIAYVNVGTHRGKGSDNHREGIRKRIESELEDRKVYYNGPSKLSHHNPICIVCYSTSPIGLNNKDFSVLLDREE